MIILWMVYKVLLLRVIGINQLRDSITIELFYLQAKDSVFKVGLDFCIFLRDHDHFVDGV